MKTSFLFFVTTLCFLSVYASKKKTMDKPTLPELVTGAGTFTILVKLLQVTELLDTVVSAKDITIFAPTDKAFALTAKDVGCKDVSSPDKIISCLSGVLSVDQIKTVLTYHVVPGVFDSKKVLKKLSFKTLSGKSFLSVGLTLIDLASGFKNPMLDAKGLDLKYDNGIVHIITRVLIPFINLAPPCKLITNPVVMANEKFITYHSLKYAARFCHPVRAAVLKCKTPKICTSFKAKYYYVAWKISVGKLVAAATTCKFVARAVAKCYHK